MKYICPECDKTIFNRRLSHSEFCNAELPEELLYSTADIERIEKESLVSEKFQVLLRARYN